MSTWQQGQRCRAHHTVARFLKYDMYTGDLHLFVNEFYEHLGAAGILVCHDGHVLGHAPRWCDPIWIKPP